MVYAAWGVDVDPVAGIAGTKTTSGRNRSGRQRP